MVLNLSKAMLDCMQNLRRRLRAELNVNIRLSEENSVQALIEACLLSDSIRTRELGIELAHMSGLDAGALSASVGQAEPVQPPSNSVFPSPPVGEGEKLVRIYRGQRVYG